MINAFLWFGFLLGLRHALEADHLAAITTFSSDRNSARAMLRIAGAWGMGHAAVLLLVGTAVTLLGLELPPAFERWASLAVGVMLLLLGIDSLRRGVGRKPDRRPALPRALLVGSVHGLEGSGALVLLALPMMHSTWRVLVFLALFGIGSLLGMITCSLAITVPLRWPLRSLIAQRTLQLAAGCTSVVFGVWVAARASL